MKLIATLLTTLGLIVSGSALAHPAEAAKKDPYVTKAEFKQVRKGMPIKKVQKIFDIPGKQSLYFDGYQCGTSFGWCPEQTRDYRTKKKYGSVSVTFVKKPGRGWVLDSKMAFWGF
jgi:hypothetical protein